MFRNQPIILLYTVIFILASSIPVNADKIEFILNRCNINYDIPEASGPVKNMPWINDEEFLKAKEKYDTPILMAGFCAVLKNPLPGEEHNVFKAAKSIKGQVIKHSKVFSQNERIGPYTLERGYKEGSSFAGDKIIMTEGGGVCKIATSLYNLTVLSNLEIVERHYHAMPVNYVPYGQDATVAYGVKDYKFKNTTEGNILIWSELVGNRLYMAFYSSEYPPEIIWNHEISNIVPPSLKYIKNRDLSPGEMITKIKGMDGASVNSSITITYSDGTVEFKKMSPSHYLPLPEIIEAN